VLHGIEGYGAHSVVHTVHFLSLIDNLPLMIIIVDSEDGIRAFLPQLDELVTEGMVTLDRSSHPLPGQQEEGPHRG